MHSWASAGRRLETAAPAVCQPLMRLTPNVPLLRPGQEPLRSIWCGWGRSPEWVGPAVSRGRVGAAQGRRQRPHMPLPRLTHPSSQSPQRISNQLHGTIAVVRPGSQACPADRGPTNGTPPPLPARSSPPSPAYERGLSLDRCPPAPPPSRAASDKLFSHPWSQGSPSDYPSQPLTFSGLTFSGHPAWSKVPRWTTPEWPGVGRGGRGRGHCVRTSRVWRVGRWLGPSR